MTVRLVKGAYWDAETIKSEMHGWPCPVWPQKWQTDACFERMAEVFLDACPRPAAPRGQGDLSTSAEKPYGVKLALGSHNVRSIASVLAGLEKRSLPREAIELQMLHGMADQLKFAAGEMGLRVREYVPVGDMIPGMAYLVRRLLENTSNESWLKAGFLDNADAGALLRAPAPLSTPPEPQPQPERHALSHSHPQVGDGRPFLTEPMRDFSVAPSVPPLPRRSRAQPCRRSPTTSPRPRPNRWSPGPTTPSPNGATQTRFSAPASSPSPPISCAASAMGSRES